MLNIATLQNPHLWLARENKRNKIKFMQNYFGPGAGLISSSRLVKNYIHGVRNEKDVATVLLRIRLADANQFE